MTWLAISHSKLINIQFGYHPTPTWTAWHRNCIHGRWAQWSRHRSIKHLPMEEKHGKTPAVPVASAWVFSGCSGKQSIETSPQHWRKLCLIWRHWRSHWRLRWRKHTSVASRHGKTMAGAYHSSDFCAESTKPRAGTHQAGKPTCGGHAGVPLSCWFHWELRIMRRASCNRLISMIMLWADSILSSAR